MTPMIDVVFQLLIFFMCTLKVIEPEGDFDISMPLGAPKANSDHRCPTYQPFKVRMQADATGELASNSASTAKTSAVVEGRHFRAELNSRVFRSITVACRPLGSDQLAEAGSRD
jgi:biopolymer transport protein ExbD